MRRIVLGAMVEAMPTTRPGRAAPAIPRAPKIASSTSESKPTTMMTKSLGAGKPRGRARIVTPWAARGFRAASLTSQPHTSNPFWRIWRAIGLKILPLPIMPTRRMTVSLISAASEGEARTIGRARASCRASRARR